MFGDPGGFSFSENIVTIVGQLGGSEPGHVLDQSQDRNVHFLVAEHMYPPYDIGQSHPLGSRDDQGSVHLHFRND